MQDLKKYLVDPLPAGASLFALFDSCHAGTMLGKLFCSFNSVLHNFIHCLDLPHRKCNKVYTYHYGPESNRPVLSFDPSTSPHFSVPRISPMVSALNLTLSAAAVPLITVSGPTGDISPGPYETLEGSLTATSLQSRTSSGQSSTRSPMSPRGSNTLLSAPVRGLSFPSPRGSLLSHCADPLVQLLSRDVSSKPASQNRRPQSSRFDGQCSLTSEPVPLVVGASNVYAMSGYDETQPILQISLGAANDNQISLEGEDNGSLVKVRCLENPVSAFFFSHRDPYARLSTTLFTPCGRMGPGQTLCLIFASNLQLIIKSGWTIVIIVRGVLSFALCDYLSIFFDIVERTHHESELRESDYDRARFTAPQHAQLSSLHPLVRQNLPSEQSLTKRTLLGYVPTSSVLAICCFGLTFMHLV
jgi:hypothetical protein